MTSDPEKPSSDEVLPPDAPFQELTDRETEYPLLKDYAGPEHESLERMVQNIEHDQLYTLFGINAERSVLLHGPPGTGKTHWVHALRNELLHRGVRLAYGEYSIGEHGTAYINMGSKILTQFYEVAYAALKTGEYDAVLIFKDEIDSLYGRRGGLHSKEDDKLLNTEMMHLQRIQNEGLPIYNVLATNFYEHLDPAAIRAGRIDQQVQFTLPTTEDLGAAYERQAERINQRAGWRVVRLADPAALGRATTGGSYADVTLILEKAVRAAVIETIHRPDSDGPRKASHVTDDLVLREVLSYRRKPLNKPPIGF